MSTQENPSIFDENTTAPVVVRSNKRRGAMVIPLQKGKDMAAKIQSEINEETRKELEQKLNLNA